MQTKLIAADWNWQSIPPKGVFNCRAKIRSSQALQDVEVTAMENGEYEVIFYSAQSAITPGQSVVLYNGDAIIGGGIIK